jgi:peptide/nickel transport system substrate-binding protein
MGHFGRPHRRVLALLFALSLVAVACGDDDDDDDGGAAAEDTTTTAATADETTTSAAGGGGTETSATSGETTTTVAEAACEETIPGSELTFGVFGLTAAVDPPNSSGALVGGTELINFYDQLMRWDPETGQFVPRLAESLEPNDDFTVWTLKLRDGIEFGDGTPLDAEAVLASMERFNPPEGVRIRNNAGGYLALITNKEVVDPLTIEFTLSQPWGTFGFALADEPGQIVNVNAIGADVAAFGQKPPPEAGVGPYTVESYTPNDSIVYKARPDYWGGPVCTETITFKLVPGSRATYDAFKAGDLDIAFIRDANVIEEARADGVEERMAIQDAGNMMVVNHRPDRPGADPLVREAIINALDENVINDRAFDGKALVMRQLIHPDSSLYSDDVESFPHDPARATAALEEAKAAGYDGQLNILCQSNPPGPDVCIAVEAMLQAVGFETTQEVLPLNDQIGRVATGDYDIAQYGYNVSASTTFIAMQQNLNSASPANRTAYADPAMDDALAALAAAENVEEQQAALAEINNLYVDFNHSFVYGATEEGIVFNDNVTGIVETHATTFLLDQVVVG